MRQEGSQGKIEVLSRQRWYGYRSDQNTFLDRLVQPKTVSRQLDAVEGIVAVAAKPSPRLFVGGEVNRRILNLDGFGRQNQG